MMTGTSEATLDHGLIDGAKRDPLPLISRLREQGPLHWLPGLDAWLATRHEDVRTLFVDPRLTADPRVYEGYRVPKQPGAERWLSEMPFRAQASDPETLGRRLVSAALTPRAVERMRGQVGDVVEQFAGPLRSRRDVVDLCEEFTVPVSATATARILGVPPKADAEARFGNIARRAARAVRPILSKKKRRKMERASVEVAEYVLSLTERRDAPGQDLISDLLAASDADSPSRIEDIVRVVAALVSVGTGTTSTACARALRSLLQNPDQLALLREDRNQMPRAVNELLRYDSGFVVMPRYVVEDFELHGCTLRKGQLVALSIMGANRDPRVFDDPDTLDLTRETKEALSFGQGRHHCIGANVARLKLQLMIDAALDFLPPGARLLEDQVGWSASGVMGQINCMPVDFGG